MRFIRRSASAVVLSLIAGAALAQPSTVILVRHAEKAANPANDPPLDDTGSARAGSLAATLADAGVNSIITTQFLRTRATVLPLAERLKLEPVTVPATRDLAAHARAVADAVRATPTGGTVLVSGHSNTIPAIIHALGGPEMPELCETDYDNLFVLEMDGERPPRLIRARYGAPDGPDAPGCARSVRQP